MQDPELEQQVRLIAEEVLDGLLASDRPPPMKRSEAPNGLSCSVGIRGDWNGEVLVHASLGLAEAAAAHMYLTDGVERPCREDAQEALREIANIVAGNVKPMLGDRNNLGLPEDVVGDVRLGGAPLAETVVERGTERLVVRVVAAV